MGQYIQERTKAVVLTGPGTYEIGDVSVPELGFQEVLCKIRAVAICGSDPEIIRGGTAGFWPPEYPFIAGHEWSGEVIAVGEGVTNFQVGDPVAGEAHKGCGYCMNCLRGRYTICLNYGNKSSGHEHYGFITRGAYAQYNKYSIKSITRIPDNVSFIEASMCDTAGVSLHGIEQTGITPGGTVAVIGPGPIGIMAMKISRALGASRVIAIGRGVRLEAAKGFECDNLINFEECDPVEAVREITKGIGADEVFECSGAKGTLNQSIRMSRRGGRIALLGVPKGDPEESVPFRYITSNEIAIFGSKANPAMSAKVLNMISSGNIKVKDMVTHTFKLDEFSEALETFEQRKGNAIKVVILPND